MMEKRDEILNATLSLIAEDGFHNLTLARIFERANTGSGTFYHYFKNKDDLIIALFEKCIEKEAALLKPYENESLETEQRIEDIVSGILKAYQSNPYEIGFVQWYCNNGIEEAFAKSTRVSPSIKAIYRIIIDGQKAGTIPSEVPAPTAARMIRSTISNAHWHCDQNSINNQADFAKIITQRALSFLA